MRTQHRAGVLLALALSSPAMAQTEERQSLELLRQTTMSLIEALVDSGVLTREKADGLIREAERKAARNVARAARRDAGDAPAAGTAPAAPVAGAPIRVPYVPESVRAELREEIKREVLSQARTEGWAAPNAIPEWTERIRLEGDLRMRYQYDHLPDSNTSPVTYLQDAVGGFTRSPDQLAVNSAGAPLGNTTDERDRWRLRLRLGAQAKINDQFSVGLRLATGNLTSRISTNQTLGNNFNAYQVVLDRAFLKADPTEWSSVWLGRMANPFFSTDLIYNTDLSFDGLAASARYKWAEKDLEPFFTVGAFPIREDSPPSSRGRWLYGTQAGVQWDASSRTRVRLGVALYDYRNFEGRVDDDYDPVLGAGSSYGQYQYGIGLREKGNTLFRTNNPADTRGATIWGLASDFRPLAFTAAMDLAHYDPYHITLTGEVVRNLGFDRRVVESRVGRPVDNGSDVGYQMRAQVGMLGLRNPGDWQAAFVYRMLGSDAVPDAFTSADWALGGTNHQGYSLQFAYTLARDTTFGLRWFSTDAAASPTVIRDRRYSVDTLQADINVRF